MAVRVPVPAFSRWCTVSVGVGGVLGAGGVVGVPEPPLPGVAGPVGGREPEGLPGRVPGRAGGVAPGADGDTPGSTVSSLRSTGRAPVPSGISWVPLR